MYRKISAMTPALVFLLLIVIPGCTNNAISPTQTTTNNVSWDDPEATALALVRDVLTPEDFAEILSHPAEFQRQVATYLFVADGKAQEEAAQLAHAFLAETEGVMQQKNATGACDQWVENKTVVRDACWAYQYTTFWSDRGLEYLYYFSPWWAVDSDNIRWGATNGRVFWALWLRNGGKIWGTHLCGKPYQLLIGNTTISAAGGAQLVLASLYLHRT